MKAEDLHGQTNLESLLLQAQEATEIPPPPKTGIPKQWLASWIRYLLKIIILPFIYLDQLAQIVAKWLIRPPFVQVGSCKRRGNCCHYILIPENKGMFGRLFHFWHTQINGFYLREPLPFESEGKKMQVMGCRYLKSDGGCSNYFFRPTICRKWPIIEYFGTPRILKGCGYKAVPRKGAPHQERLLQILQERESAATNPRAALDPAERDKT